MERATEIALIERLLGHLEAKTTTLSDRESRLSVDSYRSTARFADEQRVLFRRRPIIVAHSSELASAGDFLTHDALGVPLLVSRDRDGLVRAVLNVCRHRGARVAADERGNRKGFVCGYHGWAYGLDGALLHIPHPEGFPRTDCDRDLVAVPVAEHAGFVWVIPTPGERGREEPRPDLQSYLGVLAGELAGLAVGHVAYRTANVRRRFHWKLVIDAFLDGYHLRTLHRDSVYRFFIDNVNHADRFGPHIRSVVARKELEGARAVPQEQWRYRDFVSLTYFLFPNTVLVFHPDWISRITLFPISIDETQFTHTMLIPNHRVDATAHWDKTWSLIHERVFEREDLVAAESIQRGLDSGANTTFSCGRYEFPIRWFHDDVEQALSGIR